MADSPLSIAANIAGLLTLAAAVYAFIYVRYKTLRNSQIEMDTTCSSVLSTIEETWALYHSISRTKLATVPRRDFDVIWMEENISELYLTELGILSLCKDAKGWGINTLQFLAVDQDTFTLDESTSAADLEIHSRVRAVLQNRDRAVSLQSTKSLRLGFRNIFRHLPTLISLLRFGGSLQALGVPLRFLITFGETPALVYWYKSRKDVLKMVQEREILRSRLLFHQVSS